MAYNIIFYFTDQQRADTCGCFGQPLNITPNLDRLAEDAVVFDNCITPSPVCVAAPAVHCSRQVNILRKRDASVTMLCCRTILKHWQII